MPLYINELTIAALRLIVASGGAVELPATPPAVRYLGDKRNQNRFAVRFGSSVRVERHSSPSSGWRRYHFSTGQTITVHPVGGATTVLRVDGEVQQDENGKWLWPETRPAGAWPGVLDGTL